MYYWNTMSDPIKRKFHPKATTRLFERSFISNGDNSSKVSLRKVHYARMIRSTKQSDTQDETAWTKTDNLSPSQERIMTKKNERLFLQSKRLTSKMHTFVSIYSIFWIWDDEWQDSLQTTSQECWREKREMKACDQKENDFDEQTQGDQCPRLFLRMPEYHFASLCNLPIFASKASNALFNAAQDDDDHHHESVQRRGNSFKITRQEHSLSRLNISLERDYPCITWWWRQSSCKRSPSPWPPSTSNECKKTMLSWRSEDEERPAARVLRKIFGLISGSTSGSWWCFLESSMGDIFLALDCLWSRQTFLWNTAFMQWNRKKTLTWSAFISVMSTHRPWIQDSCLFSSE